MNSNEFIIINGEKIHYQLLKFLSNLKILNYQFQILLKI